VVTLPLPRATYRIAGGIHKYADAMGGEAIVPFDTENRPDILAICAMCPHTFADHNIYCSKCLKYTHEFMVRVPGKWWSSATDIFILRTRKFRRCDACNAEINCNSRFVQRCVNTRWGKTWRSKRQFTSSDYYIGTSSGHILYYWGANGHYCLNCARTAFKGLRAWKCTEENSWMADSNYYSDKYPPKFEVETVLFTDVLPRKPWTISLGVKTGSTTSV
jgi:hypothetical protein